MGVIILIVFVDFAKIKYTVLIFNDLLFLLKLNVEISNNRQPNLHFFGVVADKNIFKITKKKKIDY